ncbi:anomalous homeobox protein isoform X2 [Rhineura floridana]|uniref:anomalous homeobox protein isoform X2 n=1 Tax=Rhineura floridana TaxID=261503 RepID=UPI002AC820B3|nr:anomalous homeobox protein isoform X2 [Rhineura floridana]
MLSPGRHAWYHHCLLLGARRGNGLARRVKQFMAQLKKSDQQDPPQTKLRDKAGKLCQTLQHSPRSLAELVQTMAQGRHWGYLLTNVHIVQARVFVHLRQNQYDAACKLLESCKATEKADLVRLWHEIHYWQEREKRKAQSLTPVQKYRCRKRNPPPASLCPEGVKSRNYPKEVREILRRFAVEVTSKPSRQQREWLASDTNLQPCHIYNWFANYRRRKKTKASQQLQGPVITSVGIEDSACQGKPQEEGMWRSPQAAGGRCGDAGVEQMEDPLVACSPGWEWRAGGQSDNPSGALFLLHSSTVQSDQQESFCPGAEAVAGPIGAKEMTAFDPPAGPEQGTSLSTIMLETGREPPSSAATGSFWVENPVGHPYDLYPAPPLAEMLPAPRATPGAVHKGVQCSLGGWEAPCGCHCSRSTGSPATWQQQGCGRGPPDVSGEARPETVSEQADLAIEGLVLRERQLGSSWAALLPCSSPPPVLCQPQHYPLLHLPHREKSQALVPEQMMWDFASDPSTSDTLWGAWLLCEFSSSSRV